MSFGFARLNAVRVLRSMGPHGIGKIYGQEKNITTYNLACMKMLLHGTGKILNAEF